MKRIVVMDRGICGKPVFVALDESGAAAFLREKAKELRSDGLTVTFENSLTMIAKNHNQYDTYRCYEVESAI